MVEEKDGVVIIEDDAPPEESGAAEGGTKPMSEAEFVEAGFSPEEIALAKENGMVIDPEKGKGKGEGEGGDAGKGKDEKPPADKKPPETKPGDKDKKLTLPEFTAEQEAKLVEILGERPDVRAFYFRWKDEKRERQKLHDERDHLTVQTKAAAAKAAELEKRLGEAMAEVAALKVRGPAPKKTKTAEEEILDGEGGEGEGGEGGAKPKGDDDPENRPLTVKEFKELQRQQAEEARKEHEARLAAGQKRVEILNDMEEDAKVTYPDFDHVMTFTEDLLKHAKDGKLADLYPDAAEQKRVKFELRQFLALVANADRITADDLSPSDFGYAIGKKHPKFAPAGDGGEKGGGEKKPLTPDQLKKMDANSQRRSSGGVSGGGSKRAVSEDEITEEQAAKLSLSQWQKLKPATRARLLGQTGE